MPTELTDHTDQSTDNLLNGDKKPDPPRPLPAKPEDQNDSDVFRRIFDEEANELTNTAGVAADDDDVAAITQDTQSELCRPTLGSKNAWPNPSLSSAERAAQVEEGLARAREVLGREKWDNSRMAGECYYDELSDELKERYPDGIQFSYEGFPIFEPYAEQTVILEEGFGPSRQVDSKQANAACGFEKTPQGMTWHHKEDGHTLLLIDKKLHADVSHWGGVAISKALNRWNEGELK